MPRNTFERIPEEKRERFLREAARLFAEAGFDRTDMAELARRAQVAKGSVYDYFDSKEDLYLYVCRDGLERSRRAVYGEIDQHGDVYRQLRHIFLQGMVFADTHPEYVAMYVNIAAAGMEKFADQVSLEVEQRTADYLKRLIREGIAQGLVRPDVNVNLVAFVINSLYIMFLASLVSRHYRIRVKEYLEFKTNPTKRRLAQYAEYTISIIEDFLRPRGQNEPGHGQRETRQKDSRGRQ
jgi:AcrR family transcriptional regulator